MKRLIMMVLILVAVGGTTDANAQNWLKKLGKTAEKAAKNAVERSVERNVERKTEKAVDKVFNPEFEKNNQQQQQQQQQQAAQQHNNQVQQTANVNPDGTAAALPAEEPIEMTYAKSDFVPGDEIFFEDDLANEQMGEFPSKWDLIRDYAEVASFAGVKCINVEDGVVIRPLMSDMKNYLPDVFTLEFDFWATEETYGSNRERYEIYFLNEKGNKIHDFQVGGSGWSQWWYDTPDGEDRNGSGPGQNLKPGAWHHLSFSFNKRAIKMYINGVRVANIPNAAKPASLQIYMRRSVVHSKEDFKYPPNAGITNIRIAKGAVPLYDRMMTDGKFITYGITFDVGKATIKPDSMGEINRIVQLMNENPTLKFSVEGHTDSTGNPASNQTLSEQRSQAIVAKLVELGIAQDRLTAVGKGQNSPIADNNTDEGRAKNRRVEFVKM